MFEKTIEHIFKFQIGPKLAKIIYFLSDLDSTIILNETNNFDPQVENKTHFFLSFAVLIYLQVLI